MKKANLKLKKKKKKRETSNDETTDSARVHEIVSNAGTKSFI